MVFHIHSFQNRIGIMTVAVEKTVTLEKSRVRTSYRHPIKKTNQNYTYVLDVAIIGSSPASAYLAYCLAKKGVENAIFDYVDDQRPWSAAIPFRALRKFPILQAVPGPKEISSTIRIADSTGKEISIGKGFSEKVMTISEPTLKNFLIEAAVRRGTKWHKMRILNIEQERSNWKITTNRGIVKARVLVGADGVRNLVRKTIDLPFCINDLAVNMGYMVSGIGKNPILSKIVLQPERTITISNRGNHAAMSITDEMMNTLHLRKDLDNFLKTYYPEAHVFSKWASIVPNPKSPSYFEQSCAGKNWLLIGDAAGHVHPVTGDSIFYGLWSAELASQAIVAGETRVYDSLWRDEYGQELLNGLRSKKYFTNKKLFTLGLRIADKSSTFSRIFYDTFTGQESVPSVPAWILRKLPKTSWELIKAPPFGR